MQDKILLGLLLSGKKTGYQIRKIMSKSTGYFFNTSYGSIYPAFHKLMKKNHVTVSEKIIGGRLQKEYKITKEGKDAFETWLREDIHLPSYRDGALLRLFFYTNLGNIERDEKIAKYIETLEERAKELKGLRKELKALDIDAFQMATLDYGIEYYTFTAGWYRKLLSGKNK